MLKKIGPVTLFVLYGTVVLLAVALLGAFLPFVPYSIRIVESGSMSPTIPTGSLIFLSSRAGYTTGDVITFQRVSDKEVTTHRIVAERMEAGQEVYTTQGDANDTADIASVARYEVVGRVWGHVPYVGYVLNFFRQPLGFLFLVILPAVLVVEEQMRKIRRELRSSAKGEEKEKTV